MARSSRSTRGDADKNRQKLLRAAHEVLAERGFEAKITEIASRAKIGLGTIYRNYPTKESLILEITRELVNKSTVEVLSIAANVEDAREAVRRTIGVGFKRVKEYGKLAVQLVAGVAPSPYSSVMNPEALANVFRLLIRRGIDQGHFRRDLDVDYATGVWFALVSPSAFRFLGDRPPNEIVGMVCDFFLAGISARGPDTDRDEPSRRGAPRRDFHLFRNRIAHKWNKVSGTG